MVDLKKYETNEVVDCKLPNSNSIKIQSIKVEKKLWIRGKEDNNVCVEGRPCPLETIAAMIYYVSAKNDKQDVNDILNMKGHKGGVCIMKFRPMRRRMQSRCETMFELNLLAACFLYSTIVNPKLSWLVGSWDPIKPLDIPILDPRINSKWRNEKVAKIAKQDCQPLVRLHIPKVESPQERRERIFLDISLALRATVRGREAHSPLWSPTYDLVMAELAKGSDEMMIMDISEFAKLFPYDVLTITARSVAISELFTNIFKEPLWPDLFFCKCERNCGELKKNGENFVKKHILDMISGFETA